MMIKRIKKSTTAFRCRDLTAASNLFLEEVMDKTNDQRIAPLIFSMTLLGDDTVIDAGIREDWKTAIGKVLGISLKYNDLIELEIPGPAEQIPFDCLIQFLRQVALWAKSSEFDLLADTLETLKRDNDPEASVYGSITLDSWSNLMVLVKENSELGRLKFK